MHFILRTEANPLIIALSSELQCTDMVSCIATILLYNINISLILSCSSNIIYGYHLTGKWTGAVEWTIYGMDYIWNGQWDTAGDTIDTTGSTACKFSRQRNFSEYCYKLIYPHIPQLLSQKRSFRWKNDFCITANNIYLV